jgi:hypothetical protein
MSGNRSNLKNWVKGQSGNPAGRPKKIFDPVGEMKDQLAQVDENDPQKRTRGQIWIAKLISIAIGDNSGAPSIRASNEILDRLLGKPAQSLGIADLRIENREELITGILESIKAMKQAQAEDRELDGTGGGIIQ